jgi:hypothetical protein
MSFGVVWQTAARRVFDELTTEAHPSIERRGGKGKSTKAEGLFKQVEKCIDLLAANPRHPGLQTHEYLSVANPYDKDAEVFEAYAQNRTSGAYRVFWCFGPGKSQITIIAITPHP